MSVRARLYAATVVTLLGIASEFTPVRAQDIGSFFGQPGFFGFEPQPQAQPQQQERPRVRLKVTKAFKRPEAPTRAFCVRMCDGRYFTVDPADKDACRTLCPNTETTVYKGATIEAAVGPDGKPYTKAANAFRFRDQFVEQCSCVSTSSTGLSQLRIENDTTLRVGDIVANANGLMIASRGAGKRTIFRPVSRARLKAERLPGVARD
jgi:Protein of unknown function (DUF2865)